MVENIGKLAHKITTESSFVDVARIIFCMSKEMAPSPMVMFGLFVAGMGVFIAAVSFVAIVPKSALAVWIVNLCQRIAPFLFGVATAVLGITAKFFKNNIGVLLGSSTWPF